MNLYQIETALLEKFQQLLPDTVGNQGELPSATTGEIPRLFSLGFGMSQEPVQIPANENYFAIDVEINFNALYGERQDALDDLSVILTELPLSGAEISGVQRVEISSGFMITRTVWERQNDQDFGGGEERLWAVQLPMIVTVDA